ncbi:hypothetical protein SRHO_G00296310 [Serrasalmus rhombeus]
MQERIVASLKRQTPPAGLCGGFFFDELKEERLGDLVRSGLRMSDLLHAVGALLHFGGLCCDSHDLAYQHHSRWALVRVGVRCCMLYSWAAVGQQNVAHVAGAVDHSSGASSPLIWSSTQTSLKKKLFLA